MTEMSTFASSACRVAGRSTEANDDTIFSSFIHAAPSHRTHFNAAVAQARLSFTLFCVCVCVSDGAPNVHRRQQEIPNIIFYFNFFFLLGNNNDFAYKRDSGKVYRKHSQLILGRAFFCR